MRRCKMYDLCVRLTYSTMKHVVKVFRSVCRAIMCALRCAPRRTPPKHRRSRRSLRHCQVSLGHATENYASTCVDTSTDVLARQCCAMLSCRCAPASSQWSSDHAGTLELFEADLLTDGSFDEAVKGAHYVFHTASPFFIEVSSRRMLITYLCPQSHAGVQQPHQTAGAGHCAVLPALLGLTCSSTLAAAAE